LATKTVPFRLIANTLRRRPDYDSILADALVYSVLNGLLDDWVAFLMRERNAEGVAKVLEIAAPRLKDQPDFFECAGVNWETYLPLIGDPVKHLVLMRVLPQQFARIGGIPNEFIQAAVAENEIMRAFLVSFANGLDFAPFMKADLTFENAVSLFEKEFAEWKEIDGIVPKFRSFGASLQNGGLEMLALAWYAASRDRNRAFFVIEGADGLQDVARRYIAQFPDRECSAFLMSVTSELCLD
jgi:hypothetical protein